MSPTAASAVQSSPYGNSSARRAAMATHALDVGGHPRRSVRFAAVVQRVAVELPVHRRRRGGRRSRAGRRSSAPSRRGLSPSTWPGALMNSGTRIDLVGVGCGRPRASEVRRRVVVAVIRRHHEQRLLPRRQAAQVLDELGDQPCPRRRPACCGAGSGGGPRRRIRVVGGGDCLRDSRTSRFRCATSRKGWCGRMMWTKCSAGRCRRSRRSRRRVRWPDRQRCARGVAGLQTAKYAVGRRCGAGWFALPPRSRGRFAAAASSLRAVGAPRVVDRRQPVANELGSTRWP